jgi:MAP kinase interacting serine/threonine kinase
MTMAESRTSAPIDIRPGRTSRRRRTLSSSLCSSTFEDQYVIDRTVLGEGAYGMVFKCTHRITDIEYAVKIVDKRLGAPRAKVHREIEVYHQCQQSHNVLHMVEFFEDDNTFYLVFELIRGGSLEARIENSADRKSSECSVKSLVHSISLALQFLHNKGIAHRDIKPANILLPDPNSLEGAKLCDFDLASRAKSNSELRGNICMSSPVGSAEFMAPEVVRAFCAMDDERVKYDQKCDMWSLGVITYSLLAGRPPFEGKCDSKCGWDEGEPCDECQESLFNAIQSGKLEFPDNIFRNISREVIDLISRLLSKCPKMRPTPEEILSHPWFKEDDLKRLGQIKRNVATNQLRNEVITRA